MLPPTHPLMENPRKAHNSNMSITSILPEGVSRSVVTDPL